MASSHSYEGGVSNEPFVTLDITVPGEGHVAIFLRNVGDARRLVDAAVEAYRNVEAQELERRIDEVVGELPVFGGNTVTGEYKSAMQANEGWSDNSDGTFTEDDQGNWHEVK